MTPAERSTTRLRLLAVALVLVVAGCSSSGSGESGSPTTAAPPADVDVTLGLAADEPVAEVDPRFASYNLEMVTVTGGSFWAPYDADEAQAERPAIDLESERLRNLTEALGPAYMRVSGSWTAGTFFDPDGEAGDEAPDGFDAVLTGDQWRGVGAFADAVDAQVVTSYALSSGNFDEDGEWDPAQAIERMRFSEEHGIPVVAAELFNEPSLLIGFPEGYEAADYSRDHATFVEAVRREAPGMRLVGPSATNDVDTTIIEARLPADGMFEGTGEDLDVVSYHFYPKVSERCGSDGEPAMGLDAAYLDAVDATRDFYTDLRDTHAPDAPMWVTETAQAACGGDRWSSKYVDVIRLVDMFGKYAQGDGDAVFHNTLVGSDYAYLSEDGFEPRPTYWAAVLWNRLMGPTVLDAAPSGVDDVRIHAQCTPGADGATYAVINTSADQTFTVDVPGAEATLYQLTGEDLEATGISLNGTELVAADDGSLPELDGEAVEGAFSLDPASVTFVVDDTPVAACG